MKPLSTFILIILFSLLVVSTVGWRMAEYAFMSSRFDVFLIACVVFVALVGMLSLVNYFVRRW